MRAVSVAKRAAVVSTYFVGCFTGSALPVIGINTTVVADIALPA